MLILVNTDSNIEAREKLAIHVRGVVESTLHAFSHHLTRVEVHIGDELNHKSEHVKRCMIEARLEHHQPVAVTHHAASLDQAIEHAAEKLRRTLDGITERQREGSRR